MTSPIIEYFIVNGDNLLGIIYTHAMYGKVIVLNDTHINLNRDIEIHPAYSNENKADKINTLELLLQVLPK